MVQVGLGFENLLPRPIHLIMRLYSFARFLRPKCLISIFLFLCSILVLNKVVGVLFISKSSSSYTGFILQRSDSIRKFMKLHSKIRTRRVYKDKLLERGHFTTLFDDSSGESIVPGQPTNTSFCNFKYGTETLNWVENISFSPELGEEGPYRVIYNVIEVKLNHNNSKHSHLEVTYCTHATPTFLHHLVEIVRRWDGLVSIAVFVPGYDAFLSLAIIRQLCNCIPEMSKISLHFIFPAMHPPMFTAPPSNSKLFKDSEAPNKLLVNNMQTYKEQNGLVYPVNVARNVARVGAKTIYVLVSDVELLPSRNLVPEFLSMIEKFQHKHSILPFLQPSFALQERSIQKFVFVLPVFEVETTDLDIPQTKEELLYLYGKSKAVYFHRWVCLHCQRFPGLQRWLKHKKAGGSSSQIKPLLIVRREFPYHRWEPVYIGTNLEPWYSELLSWEGQQDKMTQMNEMCLLGYRFVILDEAFLVHIPGMKQRSDVTIERTAWRKPHEKRNIQIYKSIAETMLKKYKENKRCKI